MIEAFPDQSIDPQTAVAIPSHGARVPPAWGGSLVFNMCQQVSDAGRGNHNRTCQDWRHFASSRDKCMVCCCSAFLFNLLPTWFVPIDFSFGVRNKPPGTQSPKAKRALDDVDSDCTGNAVMEKAPIVQRLVEIRPHPPVFGNFSISPSSSRCGHSCWDSILTG